MRISNVEILSVAPPVERYRWSDDLPEQFMTNTLVKIQTEDGYCGIGGVWNGTSHDYDRYTAESLRNVAPTLLECDADDIAGTMFALRPRVWPLPGGALAAINAALWDRAGRVANQPVHALLGTRRTEIPAYASTPMLADVDSYLRFSEELIEQGFHAIKLHTWCIPERDLQLARVMSRTFGDQVELMLDAENNYSYDDAKAVAFELADLGFRWLEAPLPDQDVNGYRALTQHADIPIVPSGNWVQDLDTFRYCVDSKAWGAARTDVTMMGGIDVALEACQIAADAGLQCELFSWGFTLIGAANLQVMLAVDNCSYFEQPVPIGAFEYGMLDSIHPSPGGLILAPETPGLGYDADWQAMRAAAVLHLTFPNT